MNLQNMDDTRTKVAGELSVPTQYIDYYAWPQMFSSTAGPFGGVGGQVVCTYTIEAYAHGDEAVIYCNGRRLKRVSNFKPMMSV